MDRRADWAIRCVHESQLHEYSSFITLTYDDEHLPSDGGLHVQDWQKFAKRFRAHLSRAYPKGTYPETARAFRFLACGEYGEENFRPHFHAAIFGQDFSEDRILWKTKNGNPIYQSVRLTQLWGKGITSVGNLTWESAAYVAGYTTKKQVDQVAQYMRTDRISGKRVRVRAPFVIMSRRPGLASKWLDKFKSDVYPSDEVIHRGRKYRPPRYYDNTLSETALANIKAARRDFVAKRKEELTPDRLKVKEKIQQLKIQRSTRTL